MTKASSSIVKWICANLTNVYLQSKSEDDDKSIITYCEVDLCKFDKCIFAKQI